MATLARTTPRARPITPDGYERVLAAAATLLLAAVLAALARGLGQWHLVPAIVWAHLATILVALALTPWMLLRPRGSRAHRRAGYVWVGAMFGTAALSLGIRHSPTSFLGPIHALSGLVLLAVPHLVRSARLHRVDAHRRTVRGIVTGALIVAGAFTFPFDRLLGRWLFGVTSMTRQATMPNISGTGGAARHP